MVNECIRCGEEIWLDTSDYGPGGWLSSGDGGYNGRSMFCEGTDQIEHQPEEDEDEEDNNDG